jgi:hypothetical protein
MGRAEDMPPNDAMPKDDPQTRAEEEALADMATRRGEDDGGVDEDD